MSRVFHVLCVLTLAINTGFAQQKKDAKTQESKPPQTIREKVSYGFGYNIGQSFKRQNLDIQPDWVLQGIKDALGGKEQTLTQEELREAFLALQKEVQTKLAAANAKEGKAFLNANKKKEGVQSLPSGLQYKVLKSGDGASPNADDTVRTHYEGTLIDGTVFDSSKQRGQPAEFGVGQVIKGWTEALQKMKVGDKWMLYVPADLAYGASPPQGSPIGPNAVLIFEVELLGIVDENDKP